MDCTDLPEVTTGEAAKVGAWVSAVARRRDNGVGTVGVEAAEDGAEVDGGVCKGCERWTAVALNGI